MDEKQELRDRIVATGFSEKERRENFRMSHDTFMWLCSKLRNEIRRKDTVMRRAVGVEKRVAITLGVWLPMVTIAVSGTCLE